MKLDLTVIQVDLWKLKSQYLVGKAVDVGLDVLPSAHPHAAELARGGHHDAVDAAAALRPAACHAAGQAHRQPAKDASGPRHQIHLDRCSSRGVPRRVKTVSIHH